MFPEKHALGGDAKTQVLYYQALAFFSISKIRNLFTFQSALSSSQTCDWHTEWRAADVVEACAVAELH